MPTSAATCTVQYVHFSFYVRASASRNLSSLQPLKVFERVHVHAYPSLCLCCPPSSPLVPRCSGGKAALRSEQTCHHGCGWGGEHEWVFLFCFFSPLLFQSGFLPKQKLAFYVFACFVLFFISLFPACMSSLLCPPVSLWCVISVNAYLTYFYSFSVLCLHFMK